VTEDEGSQVPVACDSTGDHEPHQHEGGWCLGMPVLVPWNDEAPLTDEEAREFRERLEESLPGRQVPIDVLLPSGTVYFAATPRPGAVPLGPADDVRITVSDTRGNTYDVTGWDTPPAPGPVSALPAELARHLIAGVVRRHAEDPADPRLETMIDELAGAVTAMPGTGLAQGPGEAAYPLLKTTITQGGWDEKDRERFREQLEEHLPGAALRRTDGHYHSGQMHASHGSLAHPGWLAHDGHPLHRHSADGRTEWQPEQAPDQAQQQPGPAAVRPQHPASAFLRPDQASQWPDGTTEVNQRVDGSWDVLDPAGWRWAGWWAGDAWTDQQSGCNSTARWARQLPAAQAESEGWLPPAFDQGPRIASVSHVALIEVLRSRAEAIGSDPVYAGDDLYVALASQFRELADDLAAWHL
jgi:hypothetical protein